MRDALGFFDGFPSSVGGVALLLLLFEVASCGRVFCPVFSAFWVFVGVGGEGLGSESNRTTPACPRDVANSRAVLPWRSGILGLRSSRFNSNFTILSCPPAAAHKSGVGRSSVSVSGVLGLVSFRSNSNLTIPPCPCSAAHESGVPPHSESGVLGLTSFRCNSNLTTPSCPPAAAARSGVRPYVLPGGWD